MLFLLWIETATPGLFRQQLLLMGAVRCTDYRLVLAQSKFCSWLGTVGHSLGSKALEEISLHQFDGCWLHLAS